MFQKVQHFPITNIIVLPKGLVGISPSGITSFVSDLYTSRTSDKQETVDCGILKLLESGDSIMADRGFEIDHSLHSNGVTIIIPPFLRGKDHLTIDEEQETRQIASAHIHVEHAIARIKTVRIFNSTVGITMATNLNKMWIMCCYLKNCLPPVISEK